MADFTLAVSGVQIATWVDQPTDARPSRINASAGVPPLRYVGKPNVQIVATITLDDGTTDFTTHAISSWLAEAPGPTGFWPVATKGDDTAGIQKFTPVVPGHYVFVVRRDLGGSVAVHIDVE